MAHIQKVCSFDLNHKVVEFTFQRKSISTLPRDLMTRTPFFEVGGPTNRIPAKYLLDARLLLISTREKRLSEPPEVFPVHLSSQCPHGALEIHRQMVQKLFFSHINIVHSPGSRSRQELCMKTRLSLYYTGSNIFGIHLRGHS